MKTHDKEKEIRRPRQRKISMKVNDEQKSIVESSLCSKYNDHGFHFGEKTNEMKRRIKTTNCEQMRLKNTSNYNN